MHRNPQPEGTPKGVRRKRNARELGGIPPDESNFRTLAMANEVA